MSPGIRDVHHHTQLNPFSIQSFNPDLTGNLPCPRSYKASFQVPPMMLILNNKILGGAFDNQAMCSSPRSLQLLRRRWGVDLGLSTHGWDFLLNPLMGVSSDRR